MSVVEEAIRFGNDVWEKSRQQDLNDKRVVNVWVSNRTITRVLKNVTTWINAETDFVGFGAHHPMDDAHEARKVVGRLSKVLKSNKGKDSVMITISGKDILALEKFAVDPPPVIGEGQMKKVNPVDFLQDLGKAYLKYPNKTEPPQRLGAVRNFVSRIKKRG